MPIEEPDARASPQPLQPAAGRVFSLPVRVYWEDTDAGGIVYYANYLKFFERARTEWLRAAGVGQQALREASGLIFVVSEVQLHCRAPARLDDALVVTVQLHKAGGASMSLLQQVLRGSTLLAEGRVRVGCVDHGTFKPCRIPTALLSALS